MQPPPRKQFEPIKIVAGIKQVSRHIASLGRVAVQLA